MCDRCKKYSQCEYCGNYNKNECSCKCPSIQIDYLTPIDNLNTQSILPLPYCRLCGCGL